MMGALDENTTLDTSTWPNTVTLDQDIDEARWIGDTLNFTAPPRMLIILGRCDYDRRGPR